MMGESLKEMSDEEILDKLGKCTTLEAHLGEICDKLHREFRRRRDKRAKSPPDLTSAELDILKNIEEGE